MSTRGAYGVKFDNKVIAQYIPRDAYPSYAGRYISKFINEFNEGDKDWAKLKDNFKALRIISRANNPSDVSDLLNSFTLFAIQDLRYARVIRDYNDNPSPYVDDIIALLDFDMYFDLIYQQILTVSTNDKDFLKDGLFCEYTYIIDLDRLSLECLCRNNNITIPLNKVNLDEIKKVVCY